MSVAVTYVGQCTVVESGVSLGPDLASTDQTITHNGFNTSKSLNAGSTPPATKTASFVQALVDGAASIDLTALVGTNGGVVDGSGLKVQCLVLKAKADNANPITISVGASDGYELAGADFSVSLKAGQEFRFFGNDQTPDVAAGDKILDLAGTGTQSLDVQIVLG